MDDKRFLTNAHSPLSLCFFCPPPVDEAPPSTCTCISGLVNLLVYVKCTDDTPVPPETVSTTTGPEVGASLGRLVIANFPRGREGEKGRGREGGRKGE